MHQIFYKFRILPSLQSSNREMGFRFFTALLCFLQFAASLASRTVPSSAPSSYTNFVKISCTTTAYPQLCCASLSVYAAQIHSSPKLLADAALNITITAAQSASSAISNLSKTQALKPREAAALQDCAEELSDAVCELRQSAAEMVRSGSGGVDPGLVVNDVETWVSSALTNEDSCMDGFAGATMNGGVRTAVRKHIMNVAHMTSNALALVNIYVSSTQVVSP